MSVLRILEKSHVKKNATQQQENTNILEPQKKTLTIDTVTELQ